MQPIRPEQGQQRPEWQRNSLNLPRMAAVYTAAVAPTRPLAVTRACNQRASTAVRSAETNRRKLLVSLKAAAGQSRGASAHTHLEQTVDATHRELQACPCGPGCGLLLVALLVTHGALGTLSRQSLGSLSRHGCSLNNKESERVGGLVGA